MRVSHHHLETETRVRRHDNCQDTPRVSHSSSVLQNVVASMEYVILGLLPTEKKLTIRLVVGGACGRPWRQWRIQGEAEGAAAPL